MSDVTQILNAIDRGDTAAAEQLLPLVYNELRKLAAARLAQEKPGQTLQATALVHEAYLRLVAPGVRSQESGVGQDFGKSQNLTPDACPLTPEFHSRGHFFAAAAEAMRRIIIERARAKLTQKRSADGQRINLDEVDPAAAERSDELLALDEALNLLEQHDPQAATLVKLRYFAGLSHQEAAATLGITRRAADRLWALAKAWLYQRVADHV